MTTRGHCPACKCVYHVPAETAGKLAGAAIGAAIGHAAHRNPWALLFGVVTGIAAGEVVDRTITPRCPTCRTVLQLIGTALT